MALVESLIEQIETEALRKAIGREEVKGRQGVRATIAHVGDVAETGNMAPGNMLQSVSNLRAMGLDWHAAQTSALAGR